VRFAKVSCFCFLVFERLGITNELRASKDKLQGFLQSGYQLSALPTASPKCNFVMGTRLMMKSSVAWKLFPQQQ
jgi:hypothetical protein